MKRLVAVGVQKMLLGAVGRQVAPQWLPLTALDKHDDDMIDGQKASNVWKLGLVLTAMCHSEVDPILIQKVLGIYSIVLIEWM